MKWIIIILIVLITFLSFVALVSWFYASRLRGKPKTEKTEGKKPFLTTELWKSSGWLFAVGGQAFCLILIWQCAPEFFDRWIKTNGFWFIQLGLIVSVILLKYAKPQLVGAIVLFLTTIFLMVSILSAIITNQKMVQKGYTTIKSPKNMRPDFDDKKVLLVTPNEMFLVDEQGTNECQSVPIPFGKGFMLEIGGSVYPFKNGKPIKTGNRTNIISPNDTGNVWGLDCREISLRSIGSNVLATLHLYNAK